MSKQIIKNNLKKYRTWKNLRQKDLAKELKLSISQIRYIENKNNYPKYQVRSKICEYFGVSQDQMFYIEN
jgi:transcriptional regulator with XRE-family HTH domain